MFRLCLIALGCLLFIPGASVGETTGHVFTPPSWSDHPTAPQSMNDRLEQAANQYELEAPIPRVFFYDIAYPAGDTELAEMKGYAVMVVTAVSQDAAELPPTRLYVVVHGKKVTLRRIAGGTSTLPDDSHAAEVFGKHRWDALYLFPVYALHDGNYAAVDFAANRTGFVFARFDSTTLHDLGYAKRLTRAPRVKSPPEAAVRKLVKREFPGFMQASKPAAKQP